MEDATYLANPRFETHVNVNPERASRFPRLSQAVIDFLGLHGESAEQVVQLPATIPPVFDDSLPLTDYFVSTSHNTYLLGNQLWGKASPSSYSHVILNGARCVEIDVWPKHTSDGDTSPIVTHGWTLAEHIYFKDVCITIGDAFGKKGDDLPLFVSLECHVPTEGQQELVDIMKEAWGDKLALHFNDQFSQSGSIASVKDLRGKIVMMIEYYPPANPDNVADNLEDLNVKEEEEEVENEPRPKISEALETLGYYAHSMKPKKNWLTEDLTNPANIMINISESALSALIPTQLDAIVENARKHLRRVYPRGSRVRSGNMNPATFWRAGSHFTALNWQKFDLGMQLNEAMFCGTGGWVAKPDRLLGTLGDPERVKITVDVRGLSALPRPKKDEEYRLQARVHILYCGGEKELKSKTVKFDSKEIPEEGLDLMFDERFVAEIADDGFTFVRVLVTDDNYLKDKHLGIFCGHLQRIQQGWRFLRLLNDDGADTHATLLVRFGVTKT
ncbi:PLC-like phosphodiesterase [Schizopora paradoxa]|uniref:Phosphoinositide phospholipase C n=1 Tax=Schizopora paradoxa TaxID=27342 RepID=A0A0H2RJR5_9AGAM|nr:PLC-like phosphodiesterase [Schizopora paradoxa]